MRIAAICLILMSTAAPLAAAAQDALGVRSHDGLRRPQFPVEECSPEDGPLLPHAPIHITSDEQFTPSHGVLCGSGTADDPFVIAGWLIIGPGTSSIHIEGTSRHVFVRDNTLAGAFGDLAFSAGVRLEDAANVTVSDNTVMGSQFGVHGKGIHNVEISANVLQGAQVPLSRGLLTVSNAGVHVIDATTVSIVANEILEFGEGIGVEGASSAVEVRGNRIVDSWWAPAISVHRGPSNVLVEENDVDGGPGGILVAGGAGVDISRNRVVGVGTALDIHPWQFGTTPIPVGQVAVSNNTFADSSWAGIMNACGVCLIDHNLFQGNEDGLSVASATNVRLNVFSDNSVAIGPDSWESATFRNNTIARSNDIAVSAVGDTVDVRFNWWGDGSGPSPSALDERSGGSIIYTPWLTDAPLLAGPVS